jgi:probable O-glycosylation ligase (exosortase A-associated)
VGKIILALLIFFTVALALARPWIGIVSYYLLALLGPQYIWFWNFEGLRVSFWVAICTLLGILLKVLRHDTDFSFLKTPLNMWLLVLWFCVDLSYFLGPYVPQYESAGFKPEQLFSITNNIFLFYFCASFVVNDLKSLRYLAFVFVGSAFYMIYWANNQYLTQNWFQFNMGRLMGPISVDGGSVYCDENTFSMFFVTALPFLQYLGLEIKRRWARIIMWGAIPLGWHAIFLTGSRGGLLGIGVVTLLSVLLSKKKYLALPLLVFFLVFYQWQAGETMKQRSETITDHEDETSAQSRITAWKGGAGMIAAHPLTGVGLGSFVTALPHFIESRPRVAHSTLIQYTAESGVLAGIAYLMILVLFFLNSRRTIAWCRENEEKEGTRLLEVLNKASTISFAGLVVCSLFLSLNTYEIFFYLLIFNNTLAVLCTRQQPVTVTLEGTPAC